jgi:hypothetical protein
MPGIVHTFKRGHRIMVQIQSTWFPLVARHPQKFIVNYEQGTNADFQKATERVYYSGNYPSRIWLPVWQRYDFRETIYLSFVDESTGPFLTLERAAPYIRSRRLPQGRLQAALNQTM